MNAYTVEKENFENTFSKFKNQRIVFYGIGRYTATLLPMLEGWNIVGLMDKDTSRIGEILYGLPLISKEQAKHIADIIIINTSGTYWRLIYNRICDIGIPIYYRNGELASVDLEEQNVYSWDGSLEELKAKIEECDIVSFDFFDTLFTRQVYIPSDISCIVATSLPCEKRKEFIELRQRMGSLNVDGIEAIYLEIGKIMKLSEACRKELMNREIVVESEFLIPRLPMVQLFRYACAIGKRMFIISDMYLPTSFYLNNLKKHNICLDANNIWLSCEREGTKKNGILWAKYMEHIGERVRGIHIGDNISSDIEMCRQNTPLDTFWIMSKNEMLNRSSINRVQLEMSKDFHNWVIGLCTSRLFQNPFLLNNTKGKIYLDNLEDVGYVLFGPVIFSFSWWLINKVHTDEIQKLLFAGRDGYFLHMDYEYMCDILNNGKVESYYFETSRQIMMLANITDYTSFLEYIKFPYIGKFEEFVEDRFLIKLNKADREGIGRKEINSAQDWEVINDWLKPYMQEICKSANVVRENYLNYLQRFEINSSFTAVVDKSYYGTTQHLLINLLGKELPGYYLVADLSKTNKFTKEHKMYSCTRIMGDESAKNANVYKNTLALESFLTSPKGMLKGMSDKGFIYAENGKNQQYFEDKEIINRGVCRFIEDMLDKYLPLLYHEDIFIDKFIDEWYGIVLQNSMYEKNVIRSFFNDNAFVHRNQTNIFE